MQEFIIGTVFMISGLLGMGFGIMLIFVIGCGLFYVLGITKADYFHSEDWFLQLKVLLITFVGLLVSLYLLGSGLYDPYN